MTLLQSVPVNWQNLNEKNAVQLQSLIQEYADVFATDHMELGTTDLDQHVIDSADQTPIKQLPRRILFSLCPKVETLVQGMLTQRVVKESVVSTIVLVTKPDGTTRFCVNYRRPNSVTKVDEYPLPRVDDCLDFLLGHTYFSTLDLTSGYYSRLL